MKKKLAITTIGAVIVALIAFAGDRNESRRLSGLNPDYGHSVTNSIGFSVAYFVAGFLAMGFIVFVIPLLWRGFLKCVSQLSNSVRGK